MRLNKLHLRRASIGAAALLGVLVLVRVLAPGTIRLEPSDSQPAATPGDTAWSPVTEAEFVGADSVAPELYAAVDPDAAGQPGETMRDVPDAWLDAGASVAAEGDSATLGCIVEPSAVVEIGSAVVGLIETVAVERAEFVEAGQVLVELESDVEHAAVERARAQAQMNEQVEARAASARLGERRRDRLVQLHEQETLSLDLREEAETEAEVARLELEQARAEKRLASLQLDQAMAQLERRTIRSPVSGVVMERLMSPGERVDEEVILKIAQLDPLHVEVILPSSAIDSVEVGMRAAVVPEFPGDTVHVASTTIVDRVIDAASGTFGVRLELPNPDHEILGGLHCQVRFLSD